MSRSRAFQRAIDGVRTLPLSPQKVAQKAFFCFFRNKIQFQLNKVCYKVSLCENFQWQSCSTSSVTGHQQGPSESFGLVTERHH